MSRHDTVGKCATTVRNDKDEISVVYHKTEVVNVVKGKGEEKGNYLVTLKDGGWHSATTKARMNQAANQFGLGFHVFQKAHEWYVTTRDGSTRDFENGMQFTV